jgi:hypothetical protein
MKKDAHSEIRRVLLSFLAGELPAKRRDTIDLHLSQCPECRRYMNILADAWNAETHERPPLPLSLSWDNLVLRIQDQGKNRLAGFALGHRFRPLSARRLIASVAFPSALFLAIVTGIYIGTPTASSVPLAAETFQASSGGKAEEFGLGLFTVLPPGSLAETLAYLD